MKIGIIGLAGAGKKTLFGLLTGVQPAVGGKNAVGVFSVRDPRVDSLSEIYKPEKTIYARLDLTLLPDVEKTQGKAAWLGDVRNLDGVCCVVRSFENSAVYHPEGSVDAIRDLDVFFSELLFSDVLFLEKRKEKLAEELKKQRTPEREKELAIVLKIAERLEGGGSLRGLEFSAEEKRIISSYQFLTSKSAVAVINGPRTEALAKKLESDYSGKILSAFVDVKLEEEINRIENPAERTEFLSVLGIDEPGVAKLSRLIYSQLGLISFFTVGPDEVRAWTIRKGSPATEAARAIHTDLEKGFIRAEVMKYEDLASLKSEDEVKKAGKFSLKGKDYTVEDGDVICIRAAN